MATKTQLHWYGGEHTNCDPFRMLFNAASAEKEAMMSLNERLGDLFCRLDKNKSDGGQNCVVYMKAIECLQEEMRLLKTCYDTELSKLRREKELLAADKADADATVERTKTQLIVLESKHDDEVVGHQKRRDEIAVLKCNVRQKDNEIGELTGYIDCLKSELDLLKPKFDKYMHDCECFRQQYECEKRLRQEADDKNCQLLDKLNFDSRMHEQQVRDLVDRLENAHRIIDKLHDDINKSESGGGTSCCDTNIILQRVREQMQMEIDKYKQETEETVNRTIADMKATLDSRLREKVQLEGERGRLEMLVGTLQGQVNELQAQVSACFTSNQQLQSVMQADKSMAANVIRELEAKLLDVQDRLMQKVREVTAAREIQTSLRTEIESYKAMIECQEQRLRVPCLPPVDNGVSTKNSMYTTKGFPPRSSSTYGGSAEFQNASTACAPCVPGNSAFGCGSGAAVGGGGGGGGVAGPRCSTAPGSVSRLNSCHSSGSGLARNRNQNASGSSRPLTAGAILSRMGAGRLITGGNCNNA